MKESRMMVSPLPGFPDRVMARVQMYKQAQARRRAVIATGLLAVAFVGSLALMGFALASTFDEFTSFPSRMTSLFVLAVSFAGELYSLFDAMWLTVLTIASSINGIVVVAYACAAVALTLLWLRVAFGPFQYPLIKNLRRIER